MNLRAIAVAVFLLGMGSKASADLNLYFNNENPNYDPNDVYVTFVSPYAGTADQALKASIIGGTDAGTIAMNTGGIYNPTGTAVIYNTSNLSISQSYTLAQLSGGVDVTSATSLNFYITMGQPLATGIGDVGTAAGTGVLTFGIPSTTSGSTDPNFNIPWVAGEVTLIPSAGDYGDITAINAYNIPLKMQNFASSNATGQALQTVQTQSPNAATLAKLQALATANQANALNATTYNNLIGNGSSAGAATWTTTMSGTGPGAGSFLRQVGPPSGPTGSLAGTTTIPSVIGPYPSMQAYANYVSTAGAGGTSVSTSISGNVGSSTYSFTATAAKLGTDTDASIIITGHTTSAASLTGTTVTMTIAPDTKIGTANANYTLSNFIYESALTSNLITYTKTDGNGTTAITAAEFQALTATTDQPGNAMEAQMIHDITAGYNFGLVANTQTTTLTGTNISLNDMGSAGWTALENGKNNGTLTAAQINALLFTNTGSGTDQFYNQWAKIIFDGSSSVYGFNYSDYLQDIALYSDEVPSAFSSTGDATAVGSWMVTIDPVPEPSTWALLGGGIGALLGMCFFKRRKGALTASK